MANLIQSRSDLHVPPVTGSFLGNVAKDLTGTDAPRNAQHLPCGVIVSGTGNAIFGDINGTLFTIPAATAAVWYPVAPATISVTGDATAKIVVFWQVRLNAKL
jgi:hypothetical protein